MIRIGKLAKFRNTITFNITITCWPCWQKLSTLEPIKASRTLVQYRKYTVLGCALNRNNVMACISSSGILVYQPHPCAIISILHSPWCYSQWNEMYCICRVYCICWVYCMNCTNLLHENYVCGVFIASNRMVVLHGTLLWKESVTVL